MDVKEVQDIYTQAAAAALSSQIDNAVYQISTTHGPLISSPTVGNASVSSSTYWKERELQLAEEAKKQKIRDIRNEHKAKANKVLATAGAWLLGTGFAVAMLIEAVQNFGWGRVGEVLGLVGAVVGSVGSVVGGVKWYFRRKGETEVARFLMEEE